MKALLLTPAIVMHLLKLNSAGRVSMLECCRDTCITAEAAQGPDSLFRVQHKQSILNHIRPPP